MNDAQSVLMKRAVLGNENALTELLEQHGLQVRNELHIEPKWQGVFDRDDVMQVTYLEAYLRIREFLPGGSGSFLAWLRRIASNNLRDAVKELKRTKRPQPAGQIVGGVNDRSFLGLWEDLLQSSTTPSRIAAGTEVRGRIEIALRSLPTDYEQVLRLYELEGNSGPQVAERMGRSHGSVKMLLARARDRLKCILGSESQFFSDCS
jgi:RNA polymerase sigma-70 factor (ECF subfamily)